MLCIHAGVKANISGLKEVTETVVRRYVETRSMYSPVRVSILITLPIVMNSGAWISAPVSSLTGLVTLVAVSPRAPGSQYSTLARHGAGGVMLIGMAVEQHQRAGHPFLEILAGFVDLVRRNLELLKGVLSMNTKVSCCL